MGMAALLAEMPDLRRRFLAEHSPDQQGRCRECRNGAAPPSTWPCLPYRIATEAQRIADGKQRPKVPMQIVSSQTTAQKVVRDNASEVTGRRLKAVPAASWVPQW